MESGPLFLCLLFERVDGRPAARVEGLGREHREETVVIFMFLGCQDLKYTTKVVDLRRGGGEEWYTNIKLNSSDQKCLS